MTAAAPPAAAESNPFPGLRPFEFEDSALFFGREGQSEEILRRLRQTRFLAVVGASGSGKSSLIRAGLLPYLFGGFMPGAGSHWRPAIFRPGNDPLVNLAKALNSPDVIGAAGESEADAGRSTIAVEVTLRRSGLGLIEAIRIARLAPGENVLIIVDQFEELFRFANAGAAAHTGDDAAALVKLLLEAAGQTELPIYVVVTMRSDFIGDCAKFRDLPEAVTAGLYLIPQMTRDQRRAAIEGPVRIAGGQISPRLVNRLLNDTGDNPDLLPILQHAMMRTWDCWHKRRREGEPIDLEDYACVGQMSEALSRHADEAYAELSDRQRSIAKVVFQTLTEKGPDNREVRRPTTVADIAAVAEVPAPEVMQILEHFRQPGRCFLTSSSQTRLMPDSVIDISHESLIRGWRTLKKWVDEEAESAVIFRRLAETAVLHRAKRAGLYRDPDLQIALNWREKSHPTAAWARRYHAEFAAAMAFLDASRDTRDADARETERRRLHELHRARRVAIVISIILGFAVLCLLGLVGAYIKARESDRKATQALIQRNEALSKAKQALTAAVLARIEANKEKTEAERATASATRALEDLRIESRTERANNDRHMGVMADLATSYASRAYSPVDAITARQRAEQAQSEVGNHKSAIEQLHLILASSPGDLRAQDGLGYELLLAGRIDESIKATTEYLHADPHSWGEELNLGLAQAMKGDFADARESTNKALGFANPTDSETFDSDVAPDIQSITGHRVLYMSEPGEVRMALRYELAVLSALQGDKGAQSTDAFPAALAAADAATEHVARLDNMLFIAINWTWMHYRQCPQDYGAFAAAGALWERAAQARPQDHFEGMAAAAYKKFRNQYNLDNPDARTRYAAIDRWVEDRIGNGLDGQALPVPHRMDSRDLAMRAEELYESFAADDGTNAQKLSQVNALYSRAIGEAAREDDLEYRAYLLGKRAEIEYAARDKIGARKDSLQVLNFCGKSDQDSDLLASAHYFLALTDTTDKQKERDFADALEAEPLSYGILRDYCDFLKAHGNLKHRLELLALCARLRPDYWNIRRDIAESQEKLHQDGKDDAGLASVNLAISLNPVEASLCDLRKKIEGDLKYDDVAMRVDVAKWCRGAADAWRRRGEDGAALAAYLRSLAAIDSVPDDQANADVSFELDVAARNVSDFLSAKYPPACQTFWENVSASAVHQKLKLQAAQEITRVSAAAHPQAPPPALWNAFMVAAEQAEDAPVADIPSATIALNCGRQLAADMGSQTRADLTLVMLMLAGIKDVNASSDTFTSLNKLLPTIQAELRQGREEPDQNLISFATTLGQMRQVNSNRYKTNAGTERDGDLAAWYGALQCAIDFALRRDSRDFAIDEAFFSLCMFRVDPGKVEDVVKKIDDAASRVAADDLSMREREQSSAAFSLLESAPAKVSLSDDAIELRWILAWLGASAAETSHDTHSHQEEKEFLTKATLFFNEYRSDRAAEFDDPIMDIAGSEATFAGYLTTCGDWSDAEAYLLDAATSYSNLEGPDGTDSAPIDKQLGDVYAMSQRYDKAKLYFNEAIRIYRLDPASETNVAGVQSDSWYQKTFGSPTSGPTTKP
jgi:hypothetical protein